MGETWAATKKKIPNSNSTVLDFSQRMLHYAYKRNSEKFQNKVTVVSQDILNNRLFDNHYDFVTCAFGLKTFNPEQLVVLANETKRILKAGGHFSFIEVSKPRNLVLRKVYGFYLGRAIPVLGRLLLGNPAEYNAISEVLKPDYSQDHMTVPWELTAAGQAQQKKKTYKPKL